jgi:hypothetical protein
LLAGDIFFRHELFGAFEVCITLDSISLGLCQRRLGRLVVLLGRPEPRLCVDHGGLRRIEIALGRHRGDGHVPVGARGAGSRVIQRCLGLNHGNLVIFGIDDHEHIALMNQLALDEIHFENLAVDACAQGHDVPVYLRIIGVFVAKSIPREIGGYDGNHDHSRNHEDFLAPAC